LKIVVLSRLKKTSILLFLVFFLFLLFFYKELYSLLFFLEKTSGYSISFFQVVVPIGVAIFFSAREI